MRVQKFNWNRITEMHVIPWLIFVGVLFVLAFVGVLYVSYREEEERKHLRHTAYQEGIGEEYDLELKRLSGIQSLRPKDAQHDGPNPVRQALDNVRLQKRTMEKKSESTRPMTRVRPYHARFIGVCGGEFNLSSSTIVALNLGNVLGDLTASVQNLESHGEPQIAEALEKLACAICRSTEITDPNRKDLLENLALVSNEVSSEPDRRRPGLLKSSLGFITASLGTANELPLVHDLHEKLRAAGIINW